MFEKMLKWIRNILESYFEDNTSRDIVISSEMQGKISQWAKMYENNYDKDSGIENSVGLPSAISSEFARLVTMEYQIQLSGSTRGNYIQDSISNIDLPTILELACALGGIVLKPYVSNGKIIIDTVQGDCFYPTTFDTTGRMTGAVFVEQIKRKNKIYTRLEKHEFTAGNHSIENKAFVSNNGHSLGQEISLEQIPEWCNITNYISINNCDRPLFAYLKIPFANTIDRHSPLGVSVYSRAESLIADADKQYGRYLWEFEGGELAIDLSSDYLKERPDGEYEIPKGKKRLFRGLDLRSNGNFYQNYAPVLRDESYKRGFNTILQRIEFSCGLAYGTLSDPQNVDKTAEEVRSSKQRSYSTIKSIQKSTEKALNDLIYAIDKLSTVYNTCPSGSYTVAFDWDDSVINNPIERKQMFWQYVVAGKFPFYRYLMEFEGYTEEDAKKIQAESSQNLGEPYANT